MIKKYRLRETCEAIQYSGNNMEECIAFLGTEPYNPYEVGNRRYINDLGIGCYVCRDNLMTWVETKERFEKKWKEENQ